MHDKWGYLNITEQQSWKNMGLKKGIALTKQHTHSLKKKISEPRLVYFLMMKPFSPLENESGQ